MSTIPNNGTKSPTQPATHTDAGAHGTQPDAIKPPAQGQTPPLVRPQLVRRRAYSAPQLTHPAANAAQDAASIKSHAPPYSPGLGDQGVDEKGGAEKAKAQGQHEAAAAHQGPHGYTAPQKTGFRNGIKAQLAGLVQSRSAHTSSLARSGSVKLTAEGVAKLQNSTRMNRRAGQKLGAKFGAALGGFAGLLSAIALGPYGLVMFPFTGIAGTLGGGALGSLLGLGVGHVEPAQVQDLRKHGLYYTGVVASKKEAANIWRALAQQGILHHGRADGERETFRLPHDFTLAAAKEALEAPVVGLSAGQVKGVLDYLAYAAQAADRPG